MDQSGSRTRATRQRAKIQATADCKDCGRMADGKEGKQYCKIYENPEGYKSKKDMNAGNQKKRKYRIK